MLSRWPASRLWSLDYFKAEYGHAVITIEVYDPDAAGSFLDQTLAPSHKSVHVRDYIEGLEFGDRRCAMRENTTLFRDCPRVIEELDHLAPFSTTTSIGDDHYKALWLGPPGYVTGLHTDPGDTLLFQLFGRKEVLLFAPEEGRYLYPESRAQVGRKFRRLGGRSGMAASELALLRDHVGWSRIDPFHANTRRFPLFTRARPLLACIGAGETLFVPDGWWHAVRSRDASMSVSFQLDPSAPFFSRARGAPRPAHP